MMITNKLINDIINNKIVKIKDYEISIKNNTLRVLSETKYKSIHLKSLNVNHIKLVLNELLKEW